MGMIGEPVEVVEVELAPEIPEQPEGEPAPQEEVPVEVER
jgi:hypothetical protein